MGIRTYFAKYKELHHRYRITMDIMSAVPYDSRRLMSTNEIAVVKERLMENYDVVIEQIGRGYGKTYYRILKNAPALSTLDLAVLCSRGNLMHGYRAMDSILYIYSF